MLTPKRQLQRKRNHPNPNPNPNPNPWQEWRHFVRIMTPPREVPSYLELLLILGKDLYDACSVRKTW